MLAALSAIALLATTFDVAQRSAQAGVLACTAPPPQGAIGGVVTSAAGEDLEHLAVDAYREGDSVPTPARLIFGGYGAERWYELRELPPGVYRLLFKANVDFQDTRRHAMSWYPNASFRSQAIPVTVTANTLVTATHIALPLGGEIKGRVRHATGGQNVPLPRFDVIDAEGTVLYSQIGEADGKYGTLALRDGAYRLQFRGLGLAPGYYNAATSLAAATPVQITAAQDVSHIDGALSPYPSVIRGVLTYGGTPVPFVDVEVAPINAPETFEPVTARTQLPGGDYRIAVPPGSYRVRMVSAGDYLLQSTTVVVGTGVTETINFALALGGKITGTVTTPGGPLSLQAPLTFTLYQADTGAAVGFEFTTVRDASGGYRLRGIPSGSYKLSVTSDGYESQFYLNQSTVNAAAPINISAPGEKLLQGMTLTVCGALGTATPSGSATAAPPTATSVSTATALPTVPPGSTITPIPPGATLTPIPPGSTITPLPPGFTPTQPPAGSTETPPAPGSTITPVPPGVTLTSIPPGSTITPIPPGVTLTPIPPGSTITPIPVRTVGVSLFPKTYLPVMGR
jgi:hypothetical protein